MRLPRWLHRAYAWTLSYFWLPCPLCGRHFGGHEWLDSTDEHPATIRKPSGGGTAICPDCTRAGLGEHPVERRINVNLDGDWESYEAAMRRAAGEETS